MAKAQKMNIEQVSDMIIKYLKSKLPHAVWHTVKFSAEVNEGEDTEYDIHIMAYYQADLTQVFEYISGETIQLSGSSHLLNRTDSRDINKVIAKSLAEFTKDYDEKIIAPPKITKVQLVAELEITQL